MSENNLPEGFRLVSKENLPANAEVLGSDMLYLDFDSSEDLTQELTEDVTYNNQEFASLVEKANNPFNDELEVTQDFEKMFGDNFIVTNPFSPGFNQVQLESKSTGRKHNVVQPYAVNQNTLLSDFLKNNSPETADKNLINIYNKSGVSADRKGVFDMFKEDAFFPNEQQRSEGAEASITKIPMTSDEIINVSVDAQNEIVNKIMEMYDPDSDFLPSLYTEESDMQEGLSREQIDKINEEVYRSLYIKGHKISRDSFDNMVMQNMFKDLTNSRIKNKRKKIKLANSTEYYGGESQPTSVDIEFDYDIQVDKYLSNNKNGKTILDLNSKKKELEKNILQLKNTQNLSVSNQERLNSYLTEYSNIAKQLNTYDSDLTVNNNWVDESLLDEEEKEEIRQVQQNAINIANRQQEMQMQNGTLTNSVEQMYKDAIFEEKGLLKMGDETFVNFNLAAGGNLNRTIYNILKARGENVTIDQSAQQKRTQALNMMSMPDDPGLGNIAMIDQGLTGRGMTYLLDANGKRINNVKISYNELLDNSTSFKAFEGLFDESLNYISEDDRINFKDWNFQINKSEAEKKGFWEVAYAGTRPSKIKNPIRDINSISDVPGYLLDAGSDLFTSAVRAAGSSWFDLGPTELYKYGETKRDKLSHIENVVSLINNSEDVVSGKVNKINFNQKDKEALETGYTETTTTAVGGFIPTLAEFAMFEIATQGVGTPAALARLARAIEAGKKVNLGTRLIATPGGRFTVGALREEAKMQANTADFGLGTGAFFFGFGSLLNKIKLIENPVMSQLTNRYFTKGASGAMAIEADQLVHGVVDDFILKNKDFNDTIEELYGDEDDVFKRVVANTLMFQLTGVNARENVLTDIFTQRGRAQFAFSKNAKLRAIKKLNDKAGLDSNGVFKYNKDGTIDASSGIIKDIFDNLSEAEKGEIQSIQNDLVVDGQRISKAKRQFQKMVEILEGNPNISKLKNKLFNTVALEHTIQQRLLIENEANSLDPFLKDASGKYKLDAEGNKIINDQFERDFKARADGYFNSVRTLGVFKEGTNQFKNPEIQILKTKQEVEQFLNPGETAKWSSSKNTIYLDINEYTPGKAMHEFTHVMLDAYFDANPTAKENFINKMEAFARDTANMTFSHSQKGDVTGKQMLDFIRKEYEGKESQGEEYFTYMMELAAGPMVAATNPFLAGSLTSRLIENVRGIQGVFNKNRQTGLRNKSQVLKTIYNLSQSIYKNKLDTKTEKRLRKLALGNNKRNENISTALEIQESVGAQKQSELMEIYASDIAKTKKATKKKGNDKASKDINQISLDMGDVFSERTNDEVVNINERINESIRKGAKEAGVTPFEYKQANPEYQGLLYANNLKLISEMMKEYQKDFEFNSSVDKEAFRAAISKSLEDYAIRYGNTKFLKERAGETKEQFEARKRGVENLDSYFYNYAKQGIINQLKGNIQVQAGMSYRDGNKIIPLTKVTGETRDNLFDRLQTTESPAQSRTREFSEGKVDMTGNVKLDPIETIPSAQKKRVAEQVAEKISNIDFKNTNLNTSNVPDLTNSSSEIFGVKQSKITDKDGALKSNTTRLNASELSSFQKAIFSEGGIGLKNFYTVWSNGYLKQGARAGESTMIQKVLLDNFYKDTVIKRPNGDTWTAKEKLPFTEAESKLKEVFGLKEDGTFETIKENTKLDARAKAGIFQYLKGVSRSEVTKWLNENKPDGYQNFILEIDSGKPEGVLSKDLFADKLGSNVLDPTTKRRLLERLGDQPVFTLSTLGAVMTEPEFLFSIGTLERQSIQKATREALDDPTNIPFIKKFIETQDTKYFNEYVKNVSDATGLSLEKSKIFAEKEIGNYKQLYKELGVEYQGASPKEGFKTVTVSDNNIQEYKNTIKKVFGRLDLDMLEANNPTVFSYMLNSMNSNSMLKFRDYTGHGGRFKDGSTITKKSFGVKSSAEFVREILEDASFGKKENKEYTKKFIEKAKYAFQPSWGKDGNKGQSEALSDLYSKDRNQWLNEQQKIYASKDAIKDYVSLQDAIDATYEANKYVYKEFFKSLLDVNNSESLFLGQLQTSASSGVPRGLVSMMSVTTKPKQKEGKSTDLTHNEHALEMFNITKRFHEIKNSKISRKQKEALIDLMVEGISQHLIPKELQGVKDSSKYKGSKGRVSENDLLNTFVLEKSGQDQIFIAGEYAGLSVADVYVKRYGKEIALEVIRRAGTKLNSKGYEMKRQLENEPEIKQVEANNNKEASTYDVYVDKASKDPFNEAIDKMTIRDKANIIANKRNNPIKKIRVFDFDDTLATSNNIVIAKKGNKEVKLNAEQFAKRGLQMKEQGWEMDFSDFNKVTEGGRGPLFEVAKKIKEVRGNEDLFVLTARAKEAAPAIFEFLKAEGLEFKRENIVGLGNSTGEAKANWLIEKVSEGYNDFYFADDAYQNVKAVKDAMANYDVKSKIQQAKASLNLDTVFNKILEDKSGIDYFKDFSDAKAKAVGARKNKFQFYVPYSAEDFEGLLYPTLAKGRRGELQMDFYRENLLNPYSRAMNNLAKDRIQLMSDFKALKKQLDVPKDLKKTNDTGFTNEQAVRVYLFNKAGHEMRDLSKKDLKELLDIVESDGKLKAFADKILEITKGDGYTAPTEGWLAGTITTDLVNLLNTTKRSKYLEQWNSNVGEIFSKKNLNKLEAIFGSKYREALESSLARMKSGKNRLETGNRLSNRMLDYINGSNAAIMFFNTRSAVLQTISSANFINWSFNNPLMAGKAFANQKQYWKDFMELMNSDYLVDRRNGQKINISEAEITNAAATAKNKAKAVMAYILQKGYLPTQFADSFAIASGGATYFRNRINNLKKQGVSEAEARNRAYTEFKELSEKSQQSSDPSKISQQQSSDYGRLILMFANTPMQYTRLQKRAIQDLVNRRGDAKANVSKIIYYGFVQNLIFNALQQAVFAMGFGDDKISASDEKKLNRTVNGMLDSTLRGMGVGGATVSVLKNFLLDIYERSGRKRPEYVDSAWKLTQISPPIGSKISRIKSALYAFDSKKRRKQIQKEGISIDNPALLASAQVISATTNAPIDRVLLKLQNLRGAMDDDNELWQRIAMLAGWPLWTLQDKKEQ